MIISKYCFENVLYLINHHYHINGSKKLIDLNKSDQDQLKKSLIVDGSNIINELFNNVISDKGVL